MSKVRIEGQRFVVDPDSLWPDIRRFFADQIIKPIADTSYKDGYRAALEAMKQELADFYAKRGCGYEASDPEDGYPWALSNMRGALMSIWDRELSPNEDVWPVPSWVRKL